VPIAGFDELMLQIQEKFQLPFPLPQLQDIHNKRVAAYQKQFEALTAALRKKAETAAAEEARKPARKAAEAAVERLTKEKDWWALYLKADAEPDPVKREAIYRAGLEDFPGSAELTGNFALFMSDVRKNYDEAERLYRRALELDPNNANNTGNFALFMKNVRKNYDEAERLYQKALELDPNNANNTGNFANFMGHVRKDYGEAERLYRRALELDPNHADNTSNFAGFLLGRERFDEAEQMLKRAESLIQDAKSQVNAELALYAAILARIRNRDATPAINKLRISLSEGFLRLGWSFDNVLDVAKRRFSTKDYQLFVALADGILNPEKATAANDLIQRWLADVAMPQDGK
jgi:tetratricopeptide (TPR) repeat protein